MEPDNVAIRLLGGFELTKPEGAVTLPLGSQRLLALLALEENGLHRPTASELLWPDSSPGRAAANLRSALWGCKRAGRLLIRGAGIRLHLCTTVGVDMHTLVPQTRRILESLEPVSEPEVRAMIETLGRELLPQWSDDWIVFRRERWDQIRLHMLEAAALRLRTEQQYLPALQTALAAVSIDAIRETPHRIVIEIHIAEGNVGSALTHYQRYRTMLQRELGVRPSPRLTSLVRGLLQS